MRTKRVEDYFELIDTMISKGGPTIEDYPSLDCWMSCLDRAVNGAELSRDVLPAIRRRFGDAFSRATLQGLALTKRHGDAGGRLANGFCTIEQSTSFQNSLGLRLSHLILP